EAWQTAAGASPWRIRGINASVRRRACVTYLAASGTSFAPCRARRAHRHGEEEAGEWENVPGRGPPAVTRDVLSLCTARPLRRESMAHILIGLNPSLAGAEGAVNA